MNADDFDHGSDEASCEAGQIGPGLRERMNMIAGEALGTAWIGGLSALAATLALSGRWRTWMPATWISHTGRTVGAGR